MQIAGLSTTPASAAPDTPAKIHDAARQFESFVIAQMLKSMRDGGGSWMGTGGEDDASGDTAIGLAEEQFAKGLSAGGGLGLARLVETGLSKRTESAVPTPPDTAQKLAE